MRSRRTARARIFAGTLVGIAALLAQTRSDLRAQSLDANGQEEIVITASRRAERMQTAPIAVSAVSGRTLEDMSATDFTGYARSIPGLSFTDTGTGTQKVAIRGINPTIGSAAVKYYIGETPIPESTGNYGNTLVNPKLIDIQRIEVLRGPQGTLYGGGSVGGAIRLIPNAPDTEAFSGYAAGGLHAIDGGGWGYDGSAVINAPIVPGRVALRTAAWYENTDGFIRQNYTSPQSGSKDDLPARRTVGVRSTLQAQVTDFLDVSTMIYHQAQKLSGFQNITGGSRNPSDELVQNFPVYVPEPSSTKFTLYNLTAVADLGRVNLTSSTSYYRGQRNVAEEQSTADQALLGGPAFYGRLDETARRSEFTQELRLATKEAVYGFDAVIGGYLQNATGDRSILLQPKGFNALVAGNNPANPLYTPNDLLYGLQGTNFSREQSAFGELSYHITDRLKLTGGIRHYAIQNGTNSASDGLYNGGKSTDAVQGSFTGTVYKANLSYQLTPQHLLYATYSEGFRPGFGVYKVGPSCAADLRALGISSAPTTVQPDGVKNYEVGAKTAWLDNRLTINSAAYRMDWSNIQQSRFLPCGFSLVTNARNGARSYGFETEITARVTSLLSVGLAGSVVHATLNADEPALKAKKGDQLQDVPRYQLSAYVQQSFSLLPQTASFVRFDIAHTGSSYATYQRTADGNRDPQYDKGATTLLNARVSFTREAWDLSFYVLNIANDIERQSVVISSGADTPGRPRYTVNAPRTFGAELRRSF